MALVTDPMCGMLVDDTHSLLQSVYNGRTWSFCSVGCQRVFDANPEQYATTTIPLTELVRDPVCGMMVEPDLARHYTIVNGHRYAFCSSGCQAVFEAHPHEYLVVTE